MFTIWLHFRFFLHVCTNVIATIFLVFGLLLPYTNNDICLAAGTDRPETAINGPVDIIFDTDMGNDVDDALALAMIHALADRGECRLVAVTITNDLQNAARYVDLVDTFYGRGNIPIGLVHGGVLPEDDRFTTTLVSQRETDGQRFPRSYADNYSFLDATELLRKTLSAAADRSIVVVQVGFSTNLARLLASKADKYSPLDGKSLAAKKVRLLSVMGGAFPPEDFLSVERNPRNVRNLEYNIVKDIASAKLLFRDWPGPILLSGFEIGKAICYPCQSILDDYGYVAHHPVAEAYKLYRKMPHNRPTWDLTSVLAVVRPNRNYFGLSPRGTVTVEDDGFTSFTANPQGKCRYLTVTPEQVTRVKEAFVNLCSQPPAGKVKK